MVAAGADLGIAVYADGADLKSMLQAQKQGFVDGFTTNPTLMKKAGITDYQSFAKTVLKEITQLPISFEVFSDDFKEMASQAKAIASWGSNVNVKIPITNTAGHSAAPLIRELADQDIKLNITAVFTTAQLELLHQTLKPEDDAIISIFAGRIADTGIDPIGIMSHAVSMFKTFPKVKILWASPREVLNAYQAAQCGCHIITMTPELIAKLKLYQKDLEAYSRETVAMFYQDACAAGFSIISGDKAGHTAAGLRT